MNSYKDCIYFIFLYSVGKNQRNATSVTLHSLRQAIWGFMITWILRLPAWENAKSHSLHFFDFFPLCAFKGVLKLPAPVDAKSHWLHLFGFSLEWVFKCILKMSSWSDAKSHWFYLFDFSPLCVFKCLLKWPACEDAKSHWLHLFEFSTMIFAVKKSLSKSWSITADMFQWSGYLKLIISKDFSHFFGFSDKKWKWIFTVKVLKSISEHFVVNYDDDEADFDDDDDGKHQRLILISLVIISMMTIWWSWW